MSLDETKLRRPDFAPGAAVRLSDGQTWSLHVPRMVFRPRVGDGGRWGFTGTTDLGPRFDEIQDEVAVVTDPVAELRLLAEGAYLMLARNYDLSPDDVSDLLTYVPAGSPGYDENRAMWVAVAEALGGRAPKPTPGGGAPS